MSQTYNEGKKTKKKRKKEGKVDYAGIRLINKVTVSKMRSHLLSFE